MTINLLAKNGRSSAGNDAYFVRRAGGGGGGGSGSVTLAADSGLEFDAGALRMGTPNTLTATTVNGRNGSGHWHSIGHTNSPGTNQSILSTNSSGELYIAGEFAHPSWVAGTLHWCIKPEGNADFRDVGIDNLSINNGDIEIVGGDIFKDGTAFNNPDYVFEHYLTGKVEQNAHKAGAATYQGMLSLDELSEYIKENHKLPRVDDGKPASIFARVDRLLEKVEEQALYILQLHERIKQLEMGASNGDNFSRSD